MGDIYIALGSGGGTSSSDVTATRDKVLSGYTAMTADSDDEPVNGTLIDRGAWNGNVAMNSSITIPKGYHSGSGIVAGPSVSQRGAPTYNLPINGTQNLPEGYYSGGKVTQSIPVQGGSTTIPGTSNKTIVAANRYVNGNVVVAGDAKLVAGNIKKGVMIFGVTGTWEGQVTSPYHIQNGVNFGASNPSGYSRILENVNGSYLRYRFTDANKEISTLNSVDFAEFNYLTAYTWVDGLMSYQKQVVMEVLNTSGGVIGSTTSPVEDLGGSVSNPDILQINVSSINTNCIVRIRSTSGAWNFNISRMSLTK